MAYGNEETSIGLHRGTVDPLFSVVGVGIGALSRPPGLAVHQVRTNKRRDDKW